MQDHHLNSRKETPSPSIRFSEWNRLILDSAGEGICVLNASGTITFANPAAARMTGWAVSELTGKSQHDLLHHSYPDGRAYPWGECPICLALREGRVHQGEDEVLWRKDGSCFYVSYTTTPILRQGAAVGAVILFQDISERRRNEQWEQSKNRIFAGIASHFSLESTMQTIAEGFAAVNPEHSIAIWLRNGEDLHLTSEAARPQNPHRAIRTMRIARGGSACGEAAYWRTEVIRELEETTAPGSAPAKPDANADARTRAHPEAASPGFEHGPENGAVLSAGRRVPVSPGMARKIPPPLFSAPVAATPAGVPHSSHSAPDPIGHLRWRLAIPLVSRYDEVLAVVEILAVGPRSFEGHIRETINSACDLARLAIEHRQLHDELIRQSQLDHLTGLPNRLLLEDRLGQAIVRAKRLGTRVGVGYVDLDRFKQINDSLGHAVGDAFLRSVGETIRRSLREADTLARQGGDEFILVLPDLNEASEAVEICNRLLRELSRPLRLDGQTLVAKASIGISVYPDDGESAALLLQNADTALYAAKRAGRNRAQIYSAALGSEVHRIAQLEAALYSALDEDQFRLLYQPLYSMDQKIIGFEALLRWHHPTFGVIEPEQFIFIAEESGLIAPIGEWVLNETCRQAMEWEDAGPTPVKMFVNVSSVQLSRPDFTAKVAQALERSGLPPARLELEITESWIIADPTAATTQLRQLRQIGVGISIDDFGTGHATFSCLHQLPLDTIKIDRSFVARLDGNAANLSTIRTIVALAQQLGLKTVAEGVETQEQLEELRALDCEWLQGFLLARPLTPEIARSLLAGQGGASQECVVAAMGD